MTISQEHAILIKNLYPLKQYGAQRLLSELPDKDWKPGSINSLLKRICKTGTIVQQPGSGRPRLSHSSGEDLVLGQEDKPKRHRSAHEISHETAIFHSSVYRIIYRDLQRKCFKRCGVQLLSETSRISHLLSSAMNLIIVLLYTIIWIISK